MSSTLNSNVEDAFKCVVCFDLPYNPVALACGHIYCFWCLEKSIDLHRKCPMCSCSVTHFPRVCGLLHNLLSTSCPDKYMEKEKEALEKDSVVHYVPKIAVTDNVQKDLMCITCERLLIKPVVLNCGHVCCQTCIADPKKEVRCDVCNSLHTSTVLNVCIDLDDYLQNAYHDEYTRRDEASQSTRYEHIPYAAVDDPASVRNLHLGVGCDSCGVVPIVGERYRCKKCAGSQGYDLCATCYLALPFPPPSSRMLLDFPCDHPYDAFEIVDPPIMRSSLSVVSALQENMGGEEQW